ncbi:MAG: ComEC/Rec2 family competence protein, partial [Acidimicrobiia bacterium]
HWGLAVALGGVALVLLVGRRGGILALAALLTAGSLSGAWSAARERDTLQAAAPQGLVELMGRAADDLRPSRSGLWFLLRPAHKKEGAGWVGWPGPALLVNVGEKTPPLLSAGDLVRVLGRAEAKPGQARGDPYAGRVRAHEVEVVDPASDPLFATGNWLRDRITVGLAAAHRGPPGALVAGFLIGDVRALPEADLEAMRRAGLSHFVAVSGSNVALFLGALWLALGPVGMGRRRVLVGIIALAIFVVVTRWEPSVLRAAGVAGLLLAGRGLGIPLDAWTALGAAVAGLILVSGELVGDVGFQLSVAATTGVLAGAGLFPGARPRWAATLLGATVSAQGAVAPLLLVHFGTVPLLAPLANLLAGPLVALSTALGGVGLLLGIGPLVEAAVAGAGLVLEIARWAAPWPQLEWTGMAAAAGALALSTRRRLRPLVAVAGAGALLVALVVAGRPPGVPTVVFFDVGQGDAALLWGPLGEAILIDGGPDPGHVLDELRGRGLRDLELVVLSHPHEDHAGGLVAVLSGLSVGRVWHPGWEGEALDEVVEAARREGVPVEVPSPGWRARIGAFSIEVLGPTRRYASPNDQSLVLLVEAEGLSVLFPGDIEAIAQRELGPISADILKVPHQGAATSDLSWLAESAGSVAVISVGPNRYGHPSGQVVETLAEAGAEVLRTDLEGDVEVPLAVSSPRR